MVEILGVVTVVSQVTGVVTSVSRACVVGMVTKVSNHFDRALGGHESVRQGRLRAVVVGPVGLTARSSA